MKEEEDTLEWSAVYRAGEQAKTQELERRYVQFHRNGARSADPFLMNAERAISMEEIASVLCTR